MKDALILGLDTSCDDTGVGVVRLSGGSSTVLANIVASQTALHAEFGGVMPEQASREHLSVITKVTQQALDRAGVKLEELTHVAATYGPGLIGALLVGLTFGRNLAWSRGLPFMPIHHLEGHIASALLAAEGQSGPPFLCLIASGGHTSLFDVQAWGRYRELGRSRDDAAGEAFDKVARLLGLGYPGGGPLSQLAETGDDAAFAFTPPLRQQTGFDFSFSGLKTAVALLLQKQPEVNKADVAASFERVVVESLCTTTLRAAKHSGHTRLVVAGGVAANFRLRAALQASGFALLLPPPELATDNGAMIALAAAARLSAGVGVGPGDALTLDAAPYLPLAEAEPLPGA